MTADQEIGRNVARMRASMSQQALADQMRERGWKWSQATVWAVEKGDRPLRFVEAIDLAAILEIDLRWLQASAVETSLIQATTEAAAARRRLQDAITDYERARMGVVAAAVLAAKQGSFRVGTENEIRETPERVLTRMRETGAEGSPPRSMLSEADTLTAIKRLHEMQQDG